MVMKCVAYQNGVSIGDVTIEDISEVLQREHTFVWLGLHEANPDIRQIGKNSGCMTWRLKMPAAHQRENRDTAIRCSWCCLTAHLAKTVELATHIFMGRVFW
jgi:magnesium transporter